ncbi:YadA-like family protein [Frederiksenia canicola]
MKPLKLTVATCLLASIVPNITLASDELNKTVAKHEALIENLTTELHISTKQATKALHLADKNQREKADKTELAKKADQSYVDAKLREKANLEDIETRFVDVHAILGGKADKTELAKKSDKTYVDGKLNEKADKTELAKKADQSYVDGKLSEKADKTALTALDLRVKQNQEAIASLKPINIEGLKARSAKLEASVSKLNAQVQSNTQRLDKLNEELKRGLATQAALSGLFQPYSVGKFNVTAAVGGYKSKSAVAVGAGYRFSAHFAAKAGVAMSTGDNNASYNVGVNYEF